MSLLPLSLGSQDVTSPNIACSPKLCLFNAIHVLLNLFEFSGLFEPR